MAVQEFHVSPSQIDLYSSCPRAWAFDKIAGVPRPGNKYAERGSAVHKILENYTKFGTMPDLASPYGKIAFAALPHIPPPMTQRVEAERRYTWTVTDVPIVLITDLEDTAADRCVLITDYTSNISYAKTAEYLRTKDPQAIINAAHAWLEYRPDRVQETWLYLPTAKPHRALPVIVETDQAECLTAFDEILATAREMLVHRVQQTNPMSFPPGLGHCSAYGGCPYRDTHCYISEQEELLAKMAELSSTNSNFLSMIQSQLGIQPSEPAQVPVASQAPVVAQPAAPAVQFPPPLAANVAPAVQMPAPAPVPAEVPKRARKAPTPAVATAPTPAHDTTPPPPASDLDEFDSQVFELALSLASNPGMAASPAVDIATKAHALATALKAQRS